MMKMISLKTGDRRMFLSKEKKNGDKILRKIKLRHKANEDSTCPYLVTFNTCLTSDKYVLSVTGQ